MLVALALGALAFAAATDLGVRRAELSRQSARVAALAAEFLRSTLDQHARLLTELAVAAADDDDAAAQRLVALAPALNRGIVGTAVVGADGSIFARSPQPLADPFLVEQAAALAVHTGPEPALRFVGERGLLALARPILRGDGEIARVALILLNASVLDATPRIALGPAPGGLDILSRGAAGTAAGPAEAHFAAVAGYPLVVRYSAPLAGLIETWRAVWIRNGASAAILGVLVAVIVILWQRRARRAARRNARLKAREALALRKNLSQLADAASRADEANRTKSRFFAHVTHELRTPLNAILGFSEAIRRELFGPLGNPRYGHYAGLINEAGTHLLSLIDDLLDMAKLEAGKMEVAPIRVSAAALSRSVLDLIEVTAQQHDIAVTSSGAEDCPDLHVDLRAAKQVLINLLANAIKFTSPGGRVALDFAGRPDGGVAITISDTGIGMSTEDIVVAFQAFGRAGNGSALQRQGTGLGLPLARALVQLHGGELSLASEPGRGTTATVIFPPESAALALADSAPADSTQNRPSQNSARPTVLASPPHLAPVQAA